MGYGDNKDERSLEFSFGKLCNAIPDAAFSIMAGCSAFGGTLAVSTAAQKAIGISTASKVMPSLLGFATVCAASLVSEKAAIFSYEMKRDPQKRNWGYIENKVLNQISKTVEDRKTQLSGNAMKSSSLLRGGRNEKSHFVLPMHGIRVCLLGTLAFTVLGGRFWAISPSSFTHKGSFGRVRASIPCGQNYATPKQRVMIETMGRKWGCHTCGSKMFFKSAKSASTGKTYRFVGDHMPPKSVAREQNKMWFRRWGLWPKVKFRFYPQCVSCSNTQGSILASAGSNLDGLSSTRRALSMKGAGGGTTAYFHGFRPRINHLAGGILAATTILGASDKEIAIGNPKRLEQFQRQIENTIKRFR